jgi:abortive infection bacteriophage resistance protein
MKNWKSIDDQLGLLKSRGMAISEPIRAKKALERFGYYRLSGYWYPFKQADDDGTILDQFIPGTHMSDAVDLYVFDKKLRLLALDALERIELALQVDIAYRFGRRDACAHLKPHLLQQKFVMNGRYKRWEERYRSFETRSGKAAFVKHNKQAYGELPIWVAVQILDFGALSHLFEMLPMDIQTKIAGKYGILNGKFMIQWMRSFSQVRNASAHHERLWNSHIKDHASVPLQLVEIAQTDQYQVFRYFCLMRFFLKQLCPQSKWHIRLRDHLHSFPQPNNGAVTLKDMGVIDGWEDWDLWKE